MLGGCLDRPQVQQHARDAYPERLSDWGLIRRTGDRLVLGHDVAPYEINTPLFSDYALKLRTVFLPPGSRMNYAARGSFEFPVGSVITKTFFYPLSERPPAGAASASEGVVQAVSGWDGNVAALDLTHHRLLETRLLIRQDDGWDALPYVWHGDDAYLRITGALIPMTVAMADDSRAPLPYVVPARSECASCHATDHTSGSLQLIGLKARHLNRTYPGSARNQLVAWRDDGHLNGLPGPDQMPRAAAWDDPEAELDARARAYLDSNCGHCHNPSGAADTSGLLLDAHTSNYRQLGFCKAPVAAGRGTGGRPYSIVPNTIN
jgi:uncharacterized repeat protein (TIGR03806 family)